MRTVQTKLIVPFIFSSVVFGAKVPQPAPCPFSLVAAAKQTESGNAPAQSKAYPKGKTTVIVLNDGKFYQVSASGRDEDGTYRVDYLFTKRADGKFDVIKESQAAFEEVKTETYVSDLPPISAVAMQEANIERRRVDKAQAEYRANLLAQFSAAHNIESENYILAKKQIEKLNTEGQKHWDESQKLVFSLNLALYQQPSEKIIPQMTGCIKLFNYDRAQVLRHLNGTDKYTDTIFDPSQAPYLDVIGAFGTMRELGMTDEIAARQSKLLDQLAAIGLFK